MPETVVEPSAPVAVPPDDAPEDAPAERPSWWRRPRLLEAIGSALFTVFVAWPYLSLSQYVTLYDTITYGGPHVAFEWREWRAGHIPTWNDAMFGGIPHMANPQAAVLYPVKLLFLPFGPARAMQLITATHIFLLAAGMFFLLARRLKVRPPAAFLGTCALVGSGLVMERSTQFEQFAVIAWIPWLLAAIDWAAEQTRVRPRAIAAVGAATGMLLVAGHPQQTYLALPIMAVWAVARIVDRSAEPFGPGEPWKPRAVSMAKRLATVGCGVVLGAVLAAPQLLVTAAQLGSSVNTGGRTLLQSADPELALAPNTIARALLGVTWAGIPATSSGNLETLGFVGITICLLALLGVAATVLHRRHRWTGVLLAATVVGGILLALGPECRVVDGTRSCDKGGLLYRTLFERLPGFDQARVPGRWMLLVAVALAVLAALGVDALARRSVSKRVLAVAGVLTGLCLLAVVLTPGENVKEPGASILVWVLAGVLAVAAVVTLVVWRPKYALATGALVLLCLLVVVELGGAQRNSVARLSLYDEPFTALGGPTAELLGSRPERNLSLADNPFEDYHYLSNSLRPGTNQTFNSRSLDGYDGGVWVTRRWVTAVDPFQNTFFNNDLPLTWQIETPPNRELLARFGVKYIIIDAGGAAKVYGIPNPYSPEGMQVGADIVAKGYRGPILKDGTLWTYENPDYDEEGRVYYATRPVAEEQEAITRALGDVDPNQTLVPPGSVDLRCDGPCEPLPVRLERPRPGQVLATVDNPERGVFVVPEQNVSGWVATVDGEPVPIIPVDGMSMGIDLPPGQHTIELRYQAPGLKSGLVAMALALALLVLFTWEPRWLHLPARWRRRGNDSEGDDGDRATTDADAAATTAS